MQTMGEDANLTSELVVSYIKGFQGEEIGSHSVTTVTKHFPGAGPMENGEDSHFTYGKNQYALHLLACTRLQLTML